MRRYLFGAVALAPCLAHAATVRIDVTNVRNDHGHVLVAICSKAEFLSTHCRYVGAARAEPGEVSVSVPDVVPARYAIQVFHDENDNRQLDRNFLGMPTEGMGFSNNASFHFGPPTYADAEVSVVNPTTNFAIRIRYY
jgi:uncharacterized protein (DUF2141 family)